MSVKTIDACGQPVTVRELTVMEIRDWLKSLEFPQEGVDAVDKLLIDGEDLADLVRMTDLTPDKINRMTPAGLRRVYATCQEVNADFFGLRARLAAIGQAALTGISSALSAD